MFEKISRDIIPPINTINHSIHLIEKHSLDRETMHLKEVIRLSSAIITMCTNDYVDLNKILLKTFVPRYEPVGIKRVIGEFLEVYRLRVQQKEIELNINMDNSIP